MSFHPPYGHAPAPNGGPPPPGFLDDALLRPVSMSGAPPAQGQRGGRPGRRRDRSRGGGPERQHPRGGTEGYGERFDGPGPGPGPGPSAGPSGGYGYGMGARNDQYGAGPSQNHADESNGFRRDPAIERLKAERAQQERKCRTLFVRNISYEADVGWLRGEFERFGEIKTFFDLITKRGMLFITYYDLRNAESAKNAMHGSKINTRTMDVHYSLPKEDDLRHGCDRDKNQGTLLLYLKSGRPLPIPAVGQAFQEFGEIKDIRPSNRMGEVLVEYFDSRAVGLAADRMQNRPFLDSSLDIRLMWDEAEPAPPTDTYDGNAARRPSGEGSGRGWGPQGAPGGRTGDRGGPGPMRSRDEGRPRPGPYGDRPGPGPAAPPRFDGPPATNPDRLGEAKKIQDLLASLNQSGLVTAPPAAAPIPPPSSYGVRPPSNGGGFVSRPPAMPPASMPPQMPPTFGAPSGMPRANGYAPPLPAATPNAYAATPNPYASPAIPQGGSIPPAPAYPAYPGAAQPSVPYPPAQPGYASAGPPATYPPYPPAATPAVGSTPLNPSNGGTTPAAKDGNTAMTELLAMLVAQQKK